MLADRFIQIFQEEHRKLRDILQGLIRAFKERDKVRIRARLDQYALDVGPHLRYEEEALYPALLEAFGEENIESLLGAHDRAIGRAQKLIELGEKELLTDEDVDKAIRLIQSDLHHVIDCNSLSIMVERFPDEKVPPILDARERSLREGLDLFRWANEVRDRPPVIPEQRKRGRARESN